MKSEQRAADVLLEKVGDSSGESLREDPLKTLGLLPSNFALIFFQDLFYLRKPRNIKYWNKFVISCLTYILDKFE